MPVNVALAWIATDRSYVLEEGRIAERGAYAELMGRDGVLARMFRFQQSAGTWGRPRLP